MLFEGTYVLLNEVQSFMGVHERDLCQEKFSRKDQHVSGAWNDGQHYDPLSWRKHFRWKRLCKLKLEDEVV